MPNFQKPRYLDPVGDARFSKLLVSPPFLFRNVTARVFPLRANMAVLTNFCDNYLNMDIPPSIVHYAPALPYVYLQILNYGSMEADSIKAQNGGWVGQHEVTFTVLLQRWREENGSLVFKDWATVSPFIYVDDELSLNTGREVYGWNKVAGTIDSSVPLWLTDPRAKLRQFDLSVVDFGRPYAADTDRRHPLLHIDLDPPPTFAQFPPDPRNPWSPLWAIPNIVATGASLLGSALDTALSLRVRGFEDNRSVDSLKAMGRLAGGKLNALLPQLLPKKATKQAMATITDAVAGLPLLFFDNVTLKQFRNPEDPSLACYQALVNSRMGVDRLNRAGLLGDINLLRGDAAGGYTIDIHKLDAEPIIATLGLEVASWSDADSLEAVATLKPVLPYWLDVDLLYGAGEVICSRAPWRSGGPVGGWVDEAMPEAQPAPVADLATPSLTSAAAPATPLPPLYNTTLGAATQPIAGPFNFPDVTLQVYPLLADPAKIRTIVENHLNQPLSRMFAPGTEDLAQKVQKGWRFEPFGSYVYMMVTVYGDELGQQWSGTEDVGGFFSREVTFCIPVKWFDKAGALMSVAMMEPFTYSNSGRGVATDREVNGYNSILAKIESPNDVWLQPGGPISRRRLLSLETEVVPVLNLGQKADTLPLIQIDELKVLPDDADERWRDVADGWGREAINDLRRKTVLAQDQAGEVIDAKALALELLAHGEPFNRLIYKQYRDSLDPEDACYQALVHATSTITSVYDIRELSGDAHVRFYRQPGQPLVDALGLKVKLVDSSEGEVVDIVQPARPFWMRIAMREDLATVACYRTLDEPWRVVHPWFAAQPPAIKSPQLAAMQPPGAVAKPLSPGPYFRQRGHARTGPWLAQISQQALPLRPGGDSVIMFPARGDVEAWLPHRLDREREGANLHLDLRNNSNAWERQALVNQLAWVRVCLEPPPEGPKDEPFWEAILSASTDPAVQKLMTSPMTRPLELGLIRNITEQYSTLELRRILSTIELTLAKGHTPRLPAPMDLDDAGEAVGDEGDAPGREIGAYSERFYRQLKDVAAAFDAFFEASTPGIEKNGLAWGWDGYLDGRITNFSLQQSVANVRKLSSRQRRAFILSLAPGAQSLLTAATAFISSPQFETDHAFEDYSKLDLGKLQNVRMGIEWAGKLADIIEISLLDWLYPSRWRRLPITDAAASVEALDEVQLVIDNILSSEWESHGWTRWADPKRGRRPDEFIPDGPDIALHGAEQSLVRWIDPESGQDSNLWVAQMPAAPASSRPT